MAEEQFTPPLRERNPITTQKHRHEVFWQITVPVTVGGVLLLLIAIGVVIAYFANTGDIAKWANVSTIILIVPAMIIGLIVIAVSAGMAYLVTRGLSEAPFIARRIQDIAVLIVVRVNKASDASTEPFLRVHQFTAGLRALFRRPG
jgi:uncharacterized oligopeptide transporter (OPT) family protein